MKKVISMILNFIFSFSKINCRKIIFETGNGKVEGNPYAIYSYMKEHFPNDYRMIWFVKRGTDISKLDKQDVVYYRTWKYFKELSSAKFWIRSHSVGSLLKKKQGQIYLQVWHGGGAYKKVGYDITNDEYRPPMAHVREWDYYIASDPYNGVVIQTATGYDKEVIVLGLARSDEIINMDKSVVNDLKKRILGEDAFTAKKVILYAPTFRDQDLAKKQLSLPIDELQTLSDYIILVRLHPWVKGLIDQESLASNMINVSDYGDVQDLLLISDCLITDYSSVIFDYGLLERPMIFYTYDYDDYMKERSGFYLDFEKDLPGITVTTQTELLKCLKNFEKLKKDSQHKLKEFNKKYNALNDGHVCERVVSFMNTLIAEENHNQTGESS